MSDVTTNVVVKKISTKSDLFKVYKNLKDAEIRSTINDIIARNRKVSLKSAKNQSKLYPAEVAMFKNEVDAFYQSVG